MLAIFYALQFQPIDDISRRDGRVGRSCFQPDRRPSPRRRAVNPLHRPRWRAVELQRDLPFTVSNTASSGAATLRQALLDANAWGNFGNRVAGDSVINVTASGTVTLAARLPVIFSNVRINGNGLTVNGNNVQRCFFISGLPIEG